MTNYSKFLAILAVVFSVSAADAKIYNVTNSATTKVNVDFYLFADLMDPNTVAAGITVPLTVADNLNYVNIRPYPAGSWSGPVIRIGLSTVQDNKFTISSTAPAPSKIKIEVRSNNVIIGSGVFSKTLSF